MKCKAFTSSCTKYWCFIHLPMVTALFTFCVLWHFLYYSTSSL